jgi:hypothetical protein
MRKGVIVHACLNIQSRGNLSYYAAQIIYRKAKGKDKNVLKSIFISDPGYAHGGIPYPGSLGYNLAESLAIFRGEYSSEHNWPPQRNDDFA